MPARRRTRTTRATSARSSAGVPAGLLDKLEWRQAGPFRGGRVGAVAGDPRERNTFYFGSTGGGVWKSQDAGQYWENVSDGFFKRASVGAIAVANSDPNVVWVGMGESCIRGNVSHGDGVYRSTDGGKTWTHTGLERTRHIGKVRVHPNDPDTAYVAALGHAHGANPERGVYRTQDGGKTWKRVLYQNERAGAVDLSIDANNPRIIYATFWEAIRRPWELVSGGEGSGIFRSNDGGDTWKELSRAKGLPKGVLGKIGISASAAKSGRVYAIVEADEGGVYRSDDFGESWTRGSEDRNLRQRAWYYDHIYADPKDPETVWVLNVDAWRSSDGGRTFEQMSIPHGDHHDLWIDPNDPQRMIEGNDGGAVVTLNGGETWSGVYNQPTAEMYHVITDSQTPYRIYGAQQDNTTITIVSRAPIAGISGADTFAVGGGESGYIAVRPDDPNVVFAGNYQGTITRYDRRTGQSRNIMVWPESSSGEGAGAVKYRFQWTCPIVLSPHDPNTLYHAGNRVFRTRDEGASWEAISPDLTRNDPSKLGASGGPITKDNTGAEYYCTIFAFEESPVQKGVFWAGSDDGLVHVTRDGGRTWTNVTSNIKGFPEWGTVSIIEASPHDAATAYVVVDAHRLDNMRPYLWKTTDYGKSWKSLSGGLPNDVYLHSVREDPERKGMLYVGTERGVAFSRDDGGTWQQLGLNFPTVAVHDLRVKNGDLVVGTHGRSIWIFDDLTPIREWPKVSDKPANLFPVRPAVRWELRSGFHDDATGQNPPYGAIINYSFKEKVKGDIRLEILDPAGAVIRTYTDKKEEPEWPKDDPDGGGPDEKPVLSVEPGVHRIAWDLESQGAKKVWRAKVEGNPEAAARVPPGTYTARLVAAGATLTTPIEVKADPRVGVPVQDLQAQSLLAKQMQDNLNRLVGMATQVRSVRDQITVKRQALAGQDKAADWVKAADAVLARCDAIEGKLHNYKAQVDYDILAKGAAIHSRMSPLLSNVVQGAGAPTQGMREVAGDLVKMLDAVDVEWRSVVTEDLPALAAKAAVIDAAGIVVPGR
jgi:photosystem II stability/assembly factor-like uncharacterized protein